MEGTITTPLRRTLKREPDGSIYGSDRGGRGAKMISGSSPGRRPVSISAGRNPEHIP